MPEINGYLNQIQFVIYNPKVYVEVLFLKVDS